jgi:small-conductance mechanosensitive channel
VAQSDVVNRIVQTIDASTIASALTVLILAYAASRIFHYILVKLSEWGSLNRIGLNRITVKMLIPLLKFTIYFTAIYYIFSSIFMIASDQLILFSGLFGAGLGFGLKDLFADVVGGWLIILDRPYQLGDKVNLGGQYGEVRDIGLRATRIVTPDDSMVSVPNSSIFQNAVTNVNTGNLEMMVVIDLFIDPDSDATLAMQILKEALVTSRYVRLSEKHRFIILMKDYPLYKRIRAKGYASDFRNEFSFETDVTRRAWVEFSKQGIEPPRIGVLERDAVQFP